MRLWDLETGVTLRIYQGYSAGLWSVARHGETLYTAANDATVRRWSLATPGQWVWDLPGEPSSVAVHPAGDFVSVGFANGTLRLYALPNTGGLLAEVEDVHEVDVQRLAFGPDANLLASAGFDNTAKLWQIERTPAGPALTLVRTFESHRRAVHAVTFSPDGHTLATVGYDGQVGLFDVM